MSKFVRIDGAIGNKEEVFMLNLDLVATAKLSYQQSYSLEGPTRAHIMLSSADQVTLASFATDSVEEGKRWVLQHLGIEL